MKNNLQNLIEEGKKEFEKEKFIFRTKVYSDEDSSIDTNELHFNFFNIERFLTSQITKAYEAGRAEERKELYRKLLEIVEKTNWVEEPKSAFGRISILLSTLRSESEVKGEK